MKLLKRICIVIISVIALLIVGITFLATTEWGKEAGQESYEKHQQMDIESQENKQYVKKFSKSSEAQ